MLTSIAERIMYCLTGKTPNSVGPADLSETSDGYDFLEVKPGRILRVRHILPSRPGDAGTEEVEEVKNSGKGLIHCKRRITVYRNGQLVIENLGAALRSEILHCRNGNTEQPGTLEVELSDYTSTGNDGGGAKESDLPPGKRRKRKPKKVVLVDCQRRVSSCKGTNSDVVLFFIHGVGGSLDIWKEQLDFFSKLGYEVVAPDLVGHGSSAAPQIGAAYTFYALAEDMRCVFKRYGKKRNILVGHSYG